MSTALFPVSYVVLNDNTLGYISELHPGTMGVLAGSITRGGHAWINGPVALASSDEIRPATNSDFGFYHIDIPPDFAEARNAK